VKSDGLTGLSGSLLNGGESPARMASEFGERYKNLRRLQGKAKDHRTTNSHHEVIRENYPKKLKEKKTGMGRLLGGWGK